MKNEKNNATICSINYKWFLLYVGEPTHNSNMDLDNKDREKKNNMFQSLKEN